MDRNKVMNYLWCFWGLMDLDLWGNLILWKQHERTFIVYNIMAWYKNNNVSSTGSRHARKKQIQLLQNISIHTGLCTRKSKNIQKCRTKSRLSPMGLFTIYFFFVLNTHNIWPFRWNMGYFHRNEQKFNKIIKMWFRTLSW